MIKAVNARVKRQARDWAGISVLRTSDKGLSRVHDTNEARSDRVTKHGRVRNVRVIRRGPHTISS